MQIKLHPEPSTWAPQGLIKLTYTSDVDGVNDWAMMLPADSHDTDSTHIDNAHTWIINLHGHGSTGDQLFTRPDIRKHWLPRFTADGYAILTPNLRGNAWMSPAAVADLHALLAYLREHHHAQRFILASGSMGGTGSLIYATQHPADIAGVVALCPATDLPAYWQWAAAHEDRPILKQIHDAITTSYHHNAQSIARHSALSHIERLTMPVCVVHGDADATIPVSQSQAMAQAMKGRESFMYRELAGGNHDEPLWQLSAALDWVRERVCS